jgi:hypothetical protein
VLFFVVVDHEVINISTNIQVFELKQQKLLIEIQESHLN